MWKKWCCCWKKTKKYDPPYNRNFLSQESVHTYSSTESRRLPQPTQTTGSFINENHENNFGSKRNQGDVEPRRGETKIDENRNSSIEQETRKRKSIENNNLSQEEKSKVNLDQKNRSKIVPDERILTENEAFIETLNEIRNEAVPLIEEIEKFTELEDSNKYYFIEESLRRLVEKLDDMHEILENNADLREERKKVYKFIFPLFDRLDAKVQQNKELIAEKAQSSLKNRNFSLESLNTYRSTGFNKLPQPTQTIESFINEPHQNNFDSKINHGEIEPLIDKIKTVARASLIEQESRKRKRTENSDTTPEEYSYPDQRKRSKIIPDKRILTENETFIKSLNEIQCEAVPFIEEIEKFTELEDSNKYYFIEESLRRLIEKLDDMYEILGNNTELREERKKVYKFIFPLFDRLDEKVQNNKELIAKKEESRQ